MAIVFDAGSETNGSGVASLTVAHTCTGSNLILWAALFLVSGDTATGITYNGVAMTQATKFNVFSTQYLYWYYLANPATGTHNIVASFSSDTCQLDGASFTGALSTGIPDSVSANNGSSATATVTTTTVADNAMAVMAVRFNSGNPPTTGTNSTLIKGTAGTFISTFYSTTLQTPPGADTMTANGTNSSWGALIASFAPGSSPVVTASALTSGLTLMGVGN